MHDDAAPSAPRSDGTPHQAEAPAPIRIAPLALWRVAQAFLATLHTLFGAPEDIAAQDTFAAKSHALLASWLRCAEAMLRRLLLIEAAAYPRPATGALRRTGRPRVRREMSFWPDQPEKWRVSFRCFPSRVEGANRARHAAQNAHGARFRSAWPLAERYEALIRVFNNPAPYARRLAARLRTKPRLLAKALRAPPEAAHRVDAFDTMGERAALPWRELFSSA